MHVLATVQFSSAQRPVGAGSLSASAGKLGADGQRTSDLTADCETVRLLRSHTRVCVHVQARGRSATATVEHRDRPASLSGAVYVFER